VSLKLSKSDREKLFALEPIKISGKGKCPVEPGYIYRLSSRLTLTVDEIRTPKGGGWSLRYTLTDRRDPRRILRRTPGIFHVTSDDLDEHGDLKQPDAEELQRAAELSAYTGSSSSLASAGEAVDRKTQQGFTSEARTIDALREQKRRETWQREQDALSVYERFRIEWERAEHLGTDVHREEAAVRRMVERMAKKNQRRAA
jgi:hypothetical protein